MQEILEKEGVEEDETPQNGDFATVTRQLVKPGANVYVAIETVELNYIEIAVFGCLLEL